MKKFIDTLYNRYKESKIKFDIIVTVETTGINNIDEVVGINLIFINNFHIDATTTLYFNYQDEKRENLGLLHNKLNNNVKINKVRREQERTNNVINDLEFLYEEEKELPKLLELENLRWYFPYEFHYKFFKKNKMIDGVDSYEFLFRKRSLNNYFVSFMKENGIKINDINFFKKTDYFFDLYELKNKYIKLYFRYLELKGLEINNILNILNNNTIYLKRDFFISNYSKTYRKLTLI